MKKMRYSEIDRKISELEEALSGGRVTWIRSARKAYRNMGGVSWGRIFLFGGSPGENKP